MFRFALCTVVLLLGSGCPTIETGEYKDQRFAVKGKVTLDGQPLTNGTIAFLATTEGQRQAGGPIVNGVYDIPEGQGPNAGPHRVEIRSMKPTGKKFKDSDTGEMIDQMVEALPPRYHEKSILTATIGEQGEWNFELVGK
jgi:hypothetical protein